MWTLIEHLKDPHLVLCVQESFGVTGIRRNKTCSKPSSECYATKLTDKCFTSSENEEDVSQKFEPASEKKNYVIRNLFWYYIFVIGTELGDEIFYATFIPFWFWNIDGAVGRRVVMVWSIIMYIGQGLKDIIRWSRPTSPPVYRLQKKWSLEYGMPSTHAMVGVSIPFTVLLYSTQRYEYPLLVGLTIAVLWCSLVSVSRLYLGMHTVIDVLAGLILAVSLMAILVPLVDRTDKFLLTSRWSPVILLIVSVILIIFAPKSKIWTPTRGDTAMVVSVCVGIHIGAWANYQLGQMIEPTIPPPYKINWPTYEMMGLMFLRCSLGFTCILATRAVCKSAGHAVLCVLGVATVPHDSPSSLRNTIELLFKYITYALIGFNTLHIIPNAFKLLSIDRPAFYTEI